MHSAGENHNRVSDQNQQNSDDILNACVTSIFELLNRCLIYEMKCSSFFKCLQDPNKPSAHIEAANKLVVTYSSNQGILQSDSLSAPLSN